MQEHKLPSGEHLFNPTDLVKLILYNDDYNTFDHVIETLMFYCGFSELRAEQCAWLAHYKGKCVIKEGDREDLSNLAVYLREEGLTVEVIKA